MAETEELTKIHIDLGDNPESGGEAMWAKALGDDLYELRNSPFFAYDLNFLDIVRAIPQRPDLKPSIKAVVRRSRTSHDLDHVRGCSGARCLCHVGHGIE